MAATTTGSDDVHSGLRFQTLKDPGSWDVWFDDVKRTAIRYRIWVFVDPDPRPQPPPDPPAALHAALHAAQPGQAEGNDGNDGDVGDGQVQADPPAARPWTNEDRFPRLQPPTHPPLPQIPPAANATIRSQMQWEYSCALQGYANRMSDFRYQEAAFIRLERAIIESTRAYNAWIRDAEGPREILRALRAHVARTPYNRERDMLARYNRVLKSVKTTKLSEWLVEWQEVTRELKIINAPEAQGHRMIRSFLDAIRVLNNSFAVTWISLIEDAIDRGDEASIPSIERMAEIFRKTHDDDPSATTTTGKSSFATTLQGTDPPATTASSTTSSGQKKGSKECKIHGSESPHSSDNCYFLCKEKRPKGWPWGRQKVARKIIETKEIHKDAELVKIAQGILDKAKQPAEARAANKPAEGDVKAALATITLNDGYVYPLRDSWIWDQGTDNHISNQLTCFTDFEEIEPDPILGGDSIMQATGRGTCVIRAKGPNGVSVELTLSDVYYVPTFWTNVISNTRAEEKGYFWTGEDHWVYHRKTRKPLLQTTRIHGKDVVQFNPIEEPKPTKSVSFATSSAPRNPREADAFTWHLRMGHPSKAALEHLLSAAYGVRIKGQLTTDCSACLQAKAQAQISRRPANRKAPGPLWRIHFDLFDVGKSSTGFVKAMIFRDEYSGYIWVTCLRDKSQETVLKALTEFVNMIERQYELRVVFFRSDMEAALGNEVTDFVQGKGIRMEKSAPATPWQNGMSERSGGVIGRTARTLLVQAKFPPNLWDEAFLAATYLYNRLPKEFNNWKSPIETLHTWLRENGYGDRLPHIQDRPNLTNLYAYGCKAYPLKTGILRKQDVVELKTASRAHVGYLVGYEGSSIYRIWVPKKGRVIRTANVTFQETEFYSPDDEPAVSAEVAEFIALNDLSLQDSPDEGTQVGQALNVPEPVQEQAPEPEQAPDPEQAPESERDVAGAQPAVELGTPIPDVPAMPAVQLGTPIPDVQLGTPIPEDIPTLGAPASAYKSAFALARTHRMHRDQLPPPPKNWKELSSHQFSKEFKKAAEVEWANVKNKPTMKIIDASEATSRPLPLRWVFTYKFDDAGFLSKFKARICVRGDQQPKSDRETYAATLAGRSFRVLMALAARWDLEVRQLDAVNAFTNSELDELVYVELPEGFKEKGKVGLLIRALYGLRISPLLWQRLLSQVLESLGLEKVHEDPCIFINDWAIVFFYVDDIVVMFRNADAEKATELIDALKDRIQIRDLGELKWFLGIRVRRDRAARKIWLSQESYIEELAARFKLNRITGNIHTPYIYQDLQPYEGTASPAQIQGYQSRVGGSMYPAIITRVDAIRPAAKLSQFLKNPGPSHLAAANQCIQYLYSTRKLGLCLDGNSPDEDFRVYTDASFADNEDRRSSQGYVQTLFGAPIAWQSNKQSTVTTSTTEAELLGLTNAGKAALSTLRLLRGVRLALERPLTIWCDNKQTIRIVTSEQPRIRTALRHVDIHQCWARERVQEHDFEVKYMATSEMKADGLTKTLGRHQFKTFVKQLGMTEVPEDTED